MSSLYSKLAAANPYFLSSNHYEILCNSWTNMDTFWCKGHKVFPFIDHSVSNSCGLFDVTLKSHWDSEMHLQWSWHQRTFRRTSMPGLGQGCIHFCAQGNSQKMLKTRIRITMNRFEIVTWFWFPWFPFNTIKTQNQYILSIFSPQT